MDDTPQTPDAPPRVDRFKAVWRRIDRVLPYVLTALYAIGLALVLSRHEMWRDEMQAWLLARDAASPAELLHNMRYEGHPGLWHLLLWPAAQLTWNPVAMQAIHWALASLTVFVVLRLAPFRWPTRILLCTSYFLAFEWAAISRNYAISVLLFVIFAALHRKRWRWFPLQAVVGFAICHTNVHSLLLMLVLLPTLAIEYATAYAGNRHDARPKLAATCLGLIIIALGLATGIKQIAPPEDSGFASRWEFHWKQERAETTARTMIHAYAPLPLDRPSFWNTNQLAKEMEPDRYIGVAILIAAATTLLFLCQPWPIIPYLAGTSALLIFFYVKHPGSMRHHGFLFLLPIVLLWMCWDYKPWRLPWAWANWPSRIWHHLRELPLAALLLIHLQGSIIAVRQDWQTPFSMSKATANWIREEVPEWDDMLLAGADAPQVSAVVGHLQASDIFYAARNELGSYVVWDRQWVRVPHKVKQRLTAKMRETGKDALLITARPCVARYLPAGATLLHKVAQVAVVEPTYYIYHCPLPQP